MRRGWGMRKGWESHIETRWILLLSNEKEVRSLACTNSTTHHARRMFTGDTLADFAAFDGHPVLAHEAVDRNLEHVHLFALFLPRSDYHIPSSHILIWTATSSCHRPYQQRVRHHQLKDSASSLPPREGDFQ
jgi:hypothetical protein